jgi:hypothetical protein
MIVLFDFMSNGFLTAFMKIKMGRGKKVLTIINGKLDSYPAKGWVEGKRFYYFDRETKKDNKNKIPKFIDFEDNKENPIKRLFNVPVVTINEVTGKFVSQQDGSTLGTFDAIRQENYILRALQRPDLPNNILLIVVVIAVILCLLVSVMTLIQVMKIPGLIQGLKAMSNIAGVNV